MPFHTTSAIPADAGTSGLTLMDTVCVSDHSISGAENRMLYFWSDGVVTWLPTRPDIEHGTGKDV